MSAAAECFCEGRDFTSLHLLVVKGTIHPKNENLYVKRELYPRGRELRAGALVVKEYLFFTFF